MKMTNGIKQGLLFGWGGAVVLAFALAASPALAADPAPGAAPTQEMRGPVGMKSETTHATVTVTAIDKKARKMTVKSEDGEKTEVEVPAEVKQFDKLKVGDKIDIDYTESLAVQIAPKGTKLGTSEQTAAATGVVGRQTTVSAEVVSVDPANNKVTFKGPKGKMKTVTVKDPDIQARLPNLQPGQVVTFQYTEALAAAIQPVAK